MLEKIQQKFSRNKMMQNTKSTVSLQQKKTPDAVHKKKSGKRGQMSSGEILQKFKETMSQGEKAEGGDSAREDDPSSQNPNNGGFAMVEMLLVMMLFMLIGVTIFTLIFAGSKTYTRLNDNKNSQAEARLAMSYINVKLRQNDIAGCVSVENMPGTSNPAIVIKDLVYDSGWTTWIYYQDGMLWESIVEEGEAPSMNNALEIVPIGGFSVSGEGDAITSDITYMYGDAQRTMSHTIMLHAGLGGG